MPTNLKALKARIRSVNSTMHITKAMELVASSKVKKATARMSEGRFYRKVLEEAFADLGSSGTFYSKERPELPTLYIAIAGDRGLAGGYNNNVYKAVRETSKKGDIILPIGKKSLEHYRAHGCNILTDIYDSSEHFTSDQCADIGMLVKKEFDEGRIGKVCLVYTGFVNMLTQETRCTQILPIKPTEKKAEKDANLAYPVSTLYEPDAETVLAAVIPEYLAGVLYTSLCESFASEIAARRQAMDTATKNAEDMIDNLNLKYNRARQSAITQEITEIIGGSEAQ